MSSWLFAPPSLDDVIVLLQAWRFWLAALVLGAGIGGGIYRLHPPPYRAQATVVVDFHAEEAWPTDTDRELFYYLERETRKLEEIAWSDAVLQAVAAHQPGLTLTELRAGRLALGQPGDGGWHFYAYHQEPQQAAALAAAWAEAFAAAVREKQAQGTGLSRWIEVEVTQREGLPVTRRPALAVFLLAGGVGGMSLAALVVLFFAPWHPVGQGGHE